jgi:hypothetical protein
VRHTSRPGVVPEASEDDMYDFSRPFCMVRTGEGGGSWAVQCGERRGDIYTSGETNVLTL